MNNNPNHLNLDTSFVDLDGLVKHLRRQSFAGAVQVEFNDYRATIVIAENGKIHVREHDLTADAVTIGEKAYRRILERTKQSGGSIRVEEPRRQILYEDVADIIDDLWQCGSTDGGTIPNGHSATEHQSIPVEPRSCRDQQIIEITGELLKTVDTALNRAGIDFSLAFERACREVSGVHPFLAPGKRMFKYSAGLVYFNEQTAVTALLKGIGDALAMLFKQLAATPELSKTYRYTAQKVRVLVHERKEQFDQLFLTPHIERALSA